MTGEAYFEVAPNVEKPFVISVQEVEVTVVVVRGITILLQKMHRPMKTWVHPAYRGVLVDSNRPHSSWDILLVVYPSFDMMMTNVRGLRLYVFLDMPLVEEYPGAYSMFRGHPMSEDPSI